MKLVTRSTGDDNKRWPTYVFGGRMRTSTVGLIVAFFCTAWLYETYQPPPEPPPITQTVPPGFVPDPDYTWVPRTQVYERPQRTYPSTTTPTTTEPPEPTTTTTSPTTTSGTPGPDDPATPSGEPTTDGQPTTTVIDPDGPGGLLPPITLPVLPGPAPAPGTTPPPPAPSPN
ncbi:hypothetical protein QWI29_17540 [Mycolicibacterium neoaurum]|uniref:hypothetical protein n=1 Tax=Mycolicibacterium neoaurum TaxID=1795 RepID=UPI002673E10B|nr:hypothetical protein [Mycolicibacterium neoaurum]MDO3401849.1 hypothetical protein [Mycolicibacterium neoaurum]